MSAGLPEDIEMLDEKQRSGQTGQSDEQKENRTESNSNQVIIPHKYEL